MYETNSIDRFTQIFKRSDYLTVSECKSKLVKWGLYSEYEKGVYLNKLEFYLSVDSLINGSDNIPKDYILSVIQFDTTKFISKKSLSKTLRWLNNEYKRLNPKLPKDFKLKKSTKGGKGVVRMGRKLPKFKK